VSANVNAEYVARLRQAIATMPEAEEVALVASSPLSSGLRSTISDLREARSLVVITNSVEPQYFNLMRIPIVVGRNFESSDDPRNVIIISRRVAMEVYGMLDVIGQTFPRTPSPGGRIYTIIGVAEDANSVILEFPQSGTRYAESYLPLTLLNTTKTADLLVRARTDPKLLLGPMRDAARTIDKRVAVETRLLTTDYATRVRELTNLSVIASSLGALTLVLACIGIFGVISFGTRLRKKEISIRLALGAGRRPLVSLLMRQSMRTRNVRNVVRPGVRHSDFMGAGVSAHLYRIPRRDRSGLCEFRHCRILSDRRRDTRMARPARRHRSDAAERLNAISIRNTERQFEGESYLSG
jgi:hypothetical protein